MKRDLLAKSLAQMGSRKPASQDTDAEAVSATPHSLKSMSEVLSQVSAQSAQEVDVKEIADSEISDRFDVAVGLDDLIESIRASGQQLPVLLRYRRGEGPRYEIVYGRRRVAACRALGIQVIAHIKEMSQRDALMSQALENSARLERSFIEQALFAARLEGHSFKREEICDALAIDKAALSRLLGVARDVPTELILRIGPGHEIGRRPWLDLRKLMKEPDAPALDEILALLPEDQGALETLMELIDALRAGTRKRKPAKDKAGKRAKLVTLKDAPLRFRREIGRITIESTEEDAQEFIKHLEDTLPELYEVWSKVVDLEDPQDAT